MSRTREFALDLLGGHGIDFELRLRRQNKALKTRVSKPGAISF